MVRIDWNIRVIGVRRLGICTRWTSLDYQVRLHWIVRIDWIIRLIVAGFLG